MSKENNNDIDNHNFGRILFVDSSNEYLEFGVIDSNTNEFTVLRASQKLYKNRVSELFFVELNDFLENDVKLKLTDFESIIVTTGPGSFTGIRIGYASSEGLSVGLNLPLYGLSTLDALGFALYDSMYDSMHDNIKELRNNPYCVYYELKRGLYVGRVYNSLSNNSDNTAIIDLQDYIYFEDSIEFANSQNISVENMYISSQRQFNSKDILLTKGVCRYLNILKNSNSKKLKDILRINAYPEYFRLSEPEIALAEKTNPK